MKKVFRFENILAKNLLQITDSSSGPSRTRGPKKNPKSYADLSKWEQSRRRQQIQQIAPGVSIQPITRLSAEDSLRLATLFNLTTRQMAGIRKATDGFGMQKYQN